MKKMRKQSLYLVMYDLLIATGVCFFILYYYLYKKAGQITGSAVAIHWILFAIILFGSRFIGKIYKQIWRYGGVQCYLRLMITDMLAMLVFYIIERLIPATIVKQLTLGNTISLFTINLLLGLGMRITYRYCFKYANDETHDGKLLGKILTLFSFGKVRAIKNDQRHKIPVAILGAGKIGVSLAEDLLNNSNSNYVPRMFLENQQEKIGREIHGIEIFSEDIDKKKFEDYDIKEVIFTVPGMDIEKRQELYQRYKDLGLKVKVYDYPSLETANGKRTLREFDIEELLYRKEVLVVDEETRKYYKNKVVLITGGGGSIGSEMARQIAKMGPKRLVLLDIYENGVYDVQTELKLLHKDKINLSVEIASVCNKKAIDKIFKTYKPNIVVHAAAHKHVPLMEHNIVEAIENNVFGTLNCVETSKKYGVDRFIMVSTDKAVNPTNVMGATKRMCEMIVKTHSNTKTKTTFSMTRFGNVLGSAGSVIPLFKKQIAQGGPITVTDFRITRYFMTIPEASQLVLKSGAMAKNGELFVLDMYRPVKILDLAENMIRLVGLEPYKDIDIIETGLRPGEKLYEELLINSKTLTKTKDKLIFIEKDDALPLKKLNANLKQLKEAVNKNDDKKAKVILKKVVPTFKSPEEVNSVN